MVSEPLAQAYAKMVRAGKRNLANVYPLDLRARVTEILEETRKE